MNILPQQYIIFEAFRYVISIDYFVFTMGFVSAIALFVGALIHNGNLSSMRKSVIGIGIYSLLLIFINYARIYDTTAGFTVYKDNLFYAYAGIVTIVLTSMAWGIGVLIGVYIYKIKGWK